MKGFLYLAAGLLALAPLAGGAEPPPSREQLQHLRIRDRQLLLEQRRALLESHRRDLQAAQDLRDKGFLSAQRYRLLLNRFREAQLDYNQAEILLEQTKLELLKNAARLVVVEARKYPSPEGWSMVDITLDNQAEPRHALMVNPAFSPAEIRNLLRVENVYVSLRKGPIIGEPYELWVPALEAGERQVLTFRLLQETADIAVSLRYLDVRDEQPILFKQNPGHALPALAVTQPSQNGELGGEAIYDLTLEKPAGAERSFALALLGLPASFGGAFLDQGARVNQVRFADQAPKARLSLEVELPAGLDPAAAGRPIPFFALVTLPAEYPRINGLQLRYAGRQVPEEEVRRLQANYIRLELIPRGAGRLDLLLDSHALELAPGVPAEFEAQLVNRGSAPVRQIRPALLGPSGWETAVDPELIPLLEPGERQTLRLRALPAGGALTGDHEFTLGAQGQAETERVEAAEEHLTVRVDSPTDWAFNLLLAAAVALMAAVGLIGVRLANR